MSTGFVRARIATICLALVAVGAISSASPAFASAGNKVAYDYHLGKISVGGVDLVYTYGIGITANYHSTGSKIDKYGATQCITATNVGGKVTNRRARWVTKGKKSGTARCNATFTLAIPTPWGDINLQQFDDLQNTTAKA